MGPCYALLCKDCLLLAMHLVVQPHHFTLTSKVFGNQGDTACAKMEQKALFCYTFSSQSFWLQQLAMGKGYCRPGSQLMDKPFKSRNYTGIDRLVEL
jgi:hypothetical protein